MNRRMKDRIVTLLIAVSILFSFVNFVAAKETVSKEDRAIDFFSHLAAVRDVEFSVDKVVTRGEFAAILANICRFDYDDEITEDDLEDFENSFIFNDIVPTHKYYNEISKIISIGYMNGISENMFAPDKDLILIQAAKVLCDILGYKTEVALKGGYPSGYKEVANRLGLFKSIDKDFNDYVTQKDIAKLIYNALDINLISVSGLGGQVTLDVDSDSTFITGILKLKKITGRITDNSITSMYGVSNIADDCIVIDDTLIHVPENVLYVQDYIGREVIAYTCDVDDVDTLVYACLSGKDEAVSFDVEDFLSYSEGRIEYRNGSKKVSVVLEDNALMIRNKMAEPIYNEDTFDFLSGNVTLISNESHVDLIIIEEHEYMHVANLNHEDETVYSSLLGSDRKSRMIDFKEYDKVWITDDTGAKSTIANISQGCVLDIMKNSSVISVKIVNNIVKDFKVKSIRTDGDYTYISDGEKEYRLLPEYVESPYSDKIEMNNVYTIYTADDFAVWFVGSDDGKKVGIIIKAIYNEELEAGMFSVYETSGEYKIYTMDKKVKLLDETGTESTHTSQHICSNILNNYNEIVKFNVNAEELIVYIELPTPEPNVNGQLYELFDYKKSNQAWTGDSGYQSIWFYSKDSIFIRVPVDRKNVQKYANLTLSEANKLWGQSNTRYTKAYATEPNTAYGKYVLFIDETVEAAGVNNDRNYYVVDAIKTGLDEDDEIIQIIEGTQSSYSDGTQRITLYSKLDAVTEPDGSTHSAFEYVTDSMKSQDENGNIKRYNIQEGDIIRCLPDGYNYVSVADITYRPTVDNPTSNGGKKGWLLGSTGYHTEGTKDGNPYRLTANGKLDSWTKNFAQKGQGYMYGYILKREGNILHVTTKDITVPDSDPNDMSGGFEKYYLNVGKYVIAEYDNNGRVVSRVGKADDIKTYEEVGGECSRILLSGHWNVYLTSVIINGGSY